PIRPGSPEPSRRPGGRGLGGDPVRADPIRAGRDALLASLDRPLGSETRTESGSGGIASGGLARPAAAAHSDSDSRARGAAALIGRSPFDDDSDAAKE